MKLLVSPIDVDEAVEAIAGGADIIDIKNPREGSLGASFPPVIRRISGIAKKAGVEVSAAIGDLTYKPGTASLAALGAAALGMDYIKAGLMINDEEEAVDLMKNIVMSVEGYDVSVVTCGYADAFRVGCIPPLAIPRITAESGAKIAMLDTSVKDGKTLFDFMSAGEVKKFIECAHDCGLKAALAGSIKKEHIPVLKVLGADIVGIRSAACTGGDRKNGRISRDLVKELFRQIELSVEHDS